MLARLFVFKAVFCGLLFEGDMSPQRNDVRYPRPYVHTVCAHR